jgi:hypothetical protein
MARAPAEAVWGLPAPGRDFFRKATLRCVLRVRTRNTRTDKSENATERQQNRAAWAVGIELLRSSRPDLADGRSEATERRPRD